MLKRLICRLMGHRLVTTPWAARYFGVPRKCAWVRSDVCQRCGYWERGQTVVGETAPLNVT